MIHALLLAALVTGAAEHKHPVRPKAPAHKPAPKPPPPPVEDDEPLDLEDPPDEPEPPEPEDDSFAAPKKKHRAADDADPLKKSRPQDDLTEEQLQAIGGAAICSCLCFFVAIIALIVWLVRRASKPAAQAHTPMPPQPGAAPPPGAPPGPGVPFHLSVVAVGMNAGARQVIAQQLILAGVQADPASAADRTALVRELSKAVLGLENGWTHFGYGERLDLADEAAAQRSYQLAVEDFGRRSADTSLSGEHTYVVLTLVMCTRRQLRGVSALDDRAQIRTLLQERTLLMETDLMGAYIAWSTPLGGHEVLTRFPEMHAVR